MKGYLKDITESLDEANKEEVKEKIRDKLKLAGEDLDVLYGQAASQEQNKLDKRIKEIDKKVDALINKTGTQKARTWAEVAAGNTPGALPPAQRTTIRVRLPEAQGKTAPELLQAVRPVIQGAYAVKQLRSGDVEVMMTN